MNIGSQIRYLRKSNNLTQKELSNQLGLTPKMISFYENSERIPPIDIVVKLAEIFNVSSDYLLGVSLNPATNEISQFEFLSSDEEKLINTYRSLPSDYKQIVLGKTLEYKLLYHSELHAKKDVG